MVDIGSDGGDGGRSLVRAAEPATLGSSGSAEETQAPPQDCSKKKKKKKIMYDSSNDNDNDNNNNQSLSGLCTVSGTRR